MGKIKSLLYKRMYSEEDQRPARMIKSEKRTLWVRGKLYVFLSDEEMREAAREDPVIADAVRRDGRIV